MKYNIGIDIGSACAKTVVMDEKREIVTCLLQPTGYSSIDTAQAIRKKLVELGVDVEEAKIVATGYGRVCVPYADKSVTEITCHAKGACYLYDCDTMSVIDIGGQDTKIISVNQGMVEEFMMNDKCSAGTGKFLEVMSNTLAVRTEELCELASRGGNTTISSMCTVFAESEVISLIGRGEKKENIAFAVVDSVVQKVASQASRVPMRGAEVCLTGGLCEFDYISRRLGKVLGKEIRVKELGRYAGAVGAALSATALRK